jgi:phosphoglucomutase
MEISFDTFIIRSGPMKTETINISNSCVIRKMGTSGLREKQEIYNQPFFVEQFAQGVALFFREITDAGTLARNNRTILVGGDPRLGNGDRIRRIAGVLAGNGFRVVVAENGLTSTPAMSHGIRKLEAAGGIILTASHNPFTDVGIKINMANGAPALDDTVSRIHELQNSISSYDTADYDEAFRSGIISTVNVIRLYADLLDEIFGFADMRSEIARHGIRGAFDCMHGAAGPFARESFVNRRALEAPFLREEPRPDLGGYDESGEAMHPEPDFDYIKELISINNSGRYGIVAAWDSDVDRRLDGGGGFFIESADECALFARYSELIGIEKLFDGSIFFCRSTVTASTIDRMDKYLAGKFLDKKVRTVETSTGFKWIAELGNWGVEESNGVGNPYLREKDGIFATVFLLKIMLHTGKTARQLMEEIWSEFGRVYFTRGEVSGSLQSEKDMLSSMFDGCAELAGRRFGSLILESAGSWDYRHPLSGVVVERNAAWILNFSDGNTVKARFSGTGSGGYTLRVYCSKFDRAFDMIKSEITRPMKAAFDEFLALNGFPGRVKRYTDANQPDAYRK